MDNRMIFYVMILFFSLLVKSSENRIVAQVLKSGEHYGHFTLVNHFNCPQNNLRLDSAGDDVMILPWMYWGRYHYNNQNKLQFLAIDSVNTVAYEIAFISDNMIALKKALRNQHEEDQKNTLWNCWEKKWYISVKRQTARTTINSGNSDNYEVISFLLDSDAIHKILKIEKNCGRLALGIKFFGIGVLVVGGLCFLFFPF